MNKEQAIEEVMQAYCDCHGEFEYKGRNLDFYCDYPFTRDEAHELMNDAVEGGYNDFHADLIMNLPETAIINVAREGSVCLYISKVTKSNLKDLGADECDKENKTQWRVWWD